LVDSTPDRPPSSGFFRSWRRLYGAVLLFTLLIYAALFAFSRAFSG